ncbi:MAG: ATP-binding protein [Xenococcaceae cyanobacterium]
MPTLQELNIRGTGLGLAIAQLSVELHGGQVKIQSEVAQGTTVTVRWPFRQV